MKKWAVRFVSSFFYLGYSPIAPGTVGTLGGVALFYGLSSFQFSPGGYILFLLGFIIFSIWVSEEAEAVFGQKDPSRVVIDEVCGYLVTMFLVQPSWVNVIAGFFLFRFFDIVKPPPGRSLERFKGGAGVVMDDILAGIYANVILQVITRVIG